MRTLALAGALACGLAAGCADGVRRTDPSPAVSVAPVTAHVALRFTTLESVELTVRSTGAARIHVELGLPGGARTETLPIRPGEVARFAFALPDRARTYPVQVTALAPGANERGAAPHASVLLPGAEVMRARIAAAAADTERRARLLAQILAQRDRLHALPNRRFPTREEIARVAPAAMDAAVSHARRLATEWLQREHAIDAALLDSYLRVATTATPLDPGAACRLLGDVMRLSEIDAAGEVVFARPVLDLPSATLSLQRVTWGGELPRTGLRPIDELKRRRLKGALDDSALSIWTSANFDQLDSMVTLWNDSVRRAIETLAVPDPSDPRHLKSLWYELGTTPRTFPAGPTVRIGVEASHFSPELVLWLRFGPDRAIALRNAQSTFRGFMTVKGDPHAAGSTVVAEVPAALLYGAGNKLYARLEGFSLEDGRPISVPREIWLADLVVSDR